MNKINNELLELCEKEYSDKPLIVPLGKMDNNESVYIDFTNVSGLFIVGETNSGCANQDWLKPSSTVWTLSPRSDNANRAFVLA